MNPARLLAALMSLATLIMMVILSACSSGSSESPSQQCNDLVDTLCNRIAQCQPDAGSASSCEAMVMQSVNCATATSIKGDISACESAVNSESCSTFISQLTAGQTPSACQAN